MTFRLVMSCKDPLQTDFLIADSGGEATYTSDTVSYQRPAVHGSRATTAVTRKGPTGERLQVGLIEWPVNANQRPQIIVGTREVEMTKTGLYTSPEKFTAVDGHVYEWQIRDSRPQPSAAYIATFYSASLFIPPEGVHMLDDIVVTFIYFESQWRNRERIRSRSLKIEAYGILS
ncbi:hypothetical protein BU15DRAFT_88126 [Melanogaster broomeanus]|nr:hypothetical protein BU15DRAFT_88126 [Melanogaster broomeanus]